jgi:signal transduction histidine kinase
MAAWLRQALAAPIFEDEDKTRAAGLLNAVLLTLLTVSVGVCVWLPILNGVPTDFDEWFTLLSCALLAVIIAGLLLLLRGGHVSLASGLLSSAMWTIITLWIYTAGSIRDTTIVGYFLVIAIAGLLLGGRAAIVFGLLCILAATGAYSAEISADRVFPAHSVPFDLIVLVLCLGVAALLLRFAVDSIAQAFERARCNERALAKTNRELTQRAQRLELVSEISVAINQSMDLEAVLQTAVNGLARVLEDVDAGQIGLALLDETQEYLTVVAEHAAPGSPPAVGTKIPLRGNPSMERILATLAPLNIADAQNDPLLFSIREIMVQRQVQSILLIPLIVRGEVIGTLGCDAIGTRHTFTRDEVALTQTAANLAVARIEQARLYKEAQQEIAERVRAEAVRQRVQESLRESEARYRGLFEDSPISLWEEDFSQVKEYFDGLHTSGITDFRAYFQDHPEAVVHCAGLVKVLDVNRATVALLGARDKSEALVRLAELLADEALKVFCEELIVLAEGGQRFESEEVHRTFTGETRFITLHLSVAPSYEHSLARVLVSVLDVTERKRAEAEREALIAELEAKNAELECFTYTVSHDLTSPLVTIRGFLSFLEQDAMNRNVEQMKEDLTHISNAAEKMGRLLNELLELSRIGRAMNPPQEMALGELAREAVDLVAGRLSARGVEVEIAPDLPIIYGDRTRLRQVLQNLLDNAVKYMGDQLEPCVEIGARRDGTDTVFYVRDNGIGIEPRYHQKVFGLFEKLDPEAEGTGAGLAIVKRIVEVHGGRIWVESEGNGTGSTFCFTLASPSEATIRNRMTGGIAK